jgi:uncharacterized protein (DUF1697 family)
MAIGVALLRGINVGGKNVLPMELLRGLCGEAGLADARTYIQSGNVVFRTREDRLRGAARRLAEAIETRRGFRPSVTVRTLDEMRGVVAMNPFTGWRGIDGNRLLVMFLDNEPDVAAKRAAAGLKRGRDEIRVSGREAYLHYPEGASGASMTMAMVEKALRSSGTCRNWNTVNKLVVMAEELEAGGP